MFKEKRNGDKYGYNISTRMETNLDFRKRNDRCKT